MRTFFRYIIVDVAKVLWPVLTMWLVVGWAVCIFTPFSWIRWNTTTLTGICIESSAILTFLAVTRRITQATHHRTHLRLNIEKSLAFVAAELSSLSATCKNILTIVSIILAFLRTCSFPCVATSMGWSKWSWWRWSVCLLVRKLLISPRACAWASAWNL